MPHPPSTSISVPVGGDRPPLLRDDTLTLVHRATFGYTVEEHARATAMGFEAWRDEQLDPASIDDSQLESQLAAVPYLGMSVAQLAAAFAGQNGADNEIRRVLQGARLLRAATSRRQLLERMVEFWTDHFNIYGDGSIAFLKVVDDREVVRRHALGDFRELLGASAKSGAMLVYLDNATSVAAAPNENYSRELMELHTLGTGAGYTEQDVQEVARCLTGWTIHPPGHPNVGEFVFNPSTHDNGAKVVLGQSISAGGGLQDGETVLDLLAFHPSTARRLAEKLCVFFLSYDPPTATIDRVAAVFTATSGDIAETVRAVLSRQSFREGMVWQQLKLRRPMHMAVGAIRSAGGTVSASPQGLFDLVAATKFMGHAPFDWPAPNGYPDALGAWGANLLPRWTFATALLDNAFAGATVPNAALLAIFSGVAPSRRAGALSQHLTGGRMTPQDVAEVQGFIDSQSAFNGDVAREAVALALSLPSTQWI